MDMIKSAKNGQEDEEEEDDEFVIKKELSPHNKGFLITQRMLYFLFRKTCYPKIFAFNR